MVSIEFENLKLILLSVYWSFLIIGCICDVILLVIVVSLLKKFLVNFRIGLVNVLFSWFSVVLRLVRDLCVVLFDFSVVFLMFFLIVFWNVVVLILLCEIIFCNLLVVILYFFWSYCIIGILCFVRWFKFFMFV